MYILNLSKLQVGDIILIKRENRKSEFIRNAAGSNYSHAMLNVDGGSCIDSDGLGVQAHNPLRKLFENEDDVLVLRACEISGEQIGKIVAFARSKVGTEYSINEAKKVVRGEKNNVEENRQFCTRFVAKAYDYSGISISDNPDYCSPKEIEECKLLKVIENPLQKATKRQIEYAQEKDTPLEKQTAMHNQIFKAVRELTKEDVQTFEQIDEYMRTHPEMDEAVSKIFTEAGYYTFWEIDFNKNPWQYNYEAFKATYHRHDFQKAVAQLKDIAESLHNRFYPLYYHHKNQYSQTGLQYFKKLKDLYLKLLQLNKERMTVCADASLNKP